MVLDGWCETKLGEVATLQRGFDLPTYRRQAGSVPIISSGGVTGYHSQAKVEGPGVVTGRYGSVGEVFYIEGPFWPLNTTLWVKNFHGNDPLFVYCLLQTIEYERFSDKTGVPGINRNDIHSVSVLRPPLDEQVKIGVVIHSWQRAIDETNELLTSKLTLKKALSYQLLTGKRRFKQFGDQLWEEFSLGELFIERKETGRADLPLLAITGDRGVIPRTEVERRDSSSVDKKLYKRIVPGDIGYNTMRMWQGVSALSLIEGIVSPAYTVCAPSDRIDAQFAGYLFKFPPVVHLFCRYSQGLVDDTLSLKFPNFAKIKVTIPPVDEQKQIASVLRVLDQEIDLLRGQLELLKEQRKGLMQELLSGKIRVRVC